MSSVFVSYSHQDAAFADRLVSDLCLSAIPATYDKWLLQVGDSIIEKISAAVEDATKLQEAREHFPEGSVCKTREPIRS